MNEAIRLPAHVPHTEAWALAVSANRSWVVAKPERHCCITYPIPHVSVFHHFIIFLLENEEMNNNNEEEALGLLNRLLEQVHQAGIGKIENVVFVAPGAQYVNHVDKQVFGGTEKTHLDPETHPDPPCVGREKESSILSEVLATEAAIALWQKVQAAGWIDDNYQPLLSRTQAALLADAMAERLGIKEKWKVFETLWNRKNMYRDYYEALNQKKSLEFQDEIKKLFR